MNRATKLTFVNFMNDIGLSTSATISNCARVTELVLQDNSNLSDGAVAGIVLPALRTLSMDGWDDHDVNSNLTGASLVALAQNSPLLT